MSSRWRSRPLRSPPPTTDPNIAAPPPPPGGGGAPRGGGSGWGAGGWGPGGGAGRAAPRRGARPRHDSLGKTLHGVVLRAQALQRLAGRDAAASAVQARELAEAAACAAREARELMGDLRADRLDEQLATAVRRHAEAWSARTGLPC
jgi:hypothetical protein